MGMRITTSMMMNTYKFNLQNSTQSMSDSRNKVQTQRAFTSYAEDPASATMSWRIRRAMFSNYDYQMSNSDTYSRFNIAYTTMGVVNNDLADLDGRVSALRALNEPTGAGRQPLGQVLSNGADTIIQTMNSAKYGDHFVFAGNDEMNVPFSWGTDENGKEILLYRGVNVAAEEVEMPERIAGVTPAWVPAVGDYSMPKEIPAKEALPALPAGVTEDNMDDPAVIGGLSDADKQQVEDYKNAKNQNDWVDYYNSDWAKLQAMSHEEQNVDLGMGLQEDENGNLINGSAFNRALPGINMLGGFGLDEDGDPKNVVLILKRLGELCSNCDPDTGAWDSDTAKANEIANEVNRLTSKLIDSRSRTTEAYTEITTKGHFLKENQSRLETQGDDLQEERVNLEQIDPAAAITEFMYDYYCYSAALKIGTQLLSQSLLDYMG